MGYTSQYNLISIDYLRSDYFIGLLARHFSFSEKKAETLSIVFGV